MKPINWDAVEENQEYENVKPGGYVAKIFTAQDKPDKEYIEMCVDIAEGEYTNYYEELAKRKDYWALKLYRSYKDSALGFFKSFYKAVESSNPGYKWNNDERTLMGKYIGIILQEEEYEKNDGTTGTRLKISKTLPVADIRNGNFKVPVKKELPKEAPKVTGNESFMNVSDSVNPFNA